MVWLDLPLGLLSPVLAFVMYCPWLPVRMPSVVGGLGETGIKC